MFMFDPLFDLQIVIALLFVALVVSVVSGLLKKNFCFAGRLFSILANVILIAVIFVGSEVFDAYNIRWLMWTSITVWPLLNIFLVLKNCKK